MRILLDAMGSDEHPRPEIEAAILAAEEFGETIGLVGDKKQLAPLLGKDNKDIEIIHADEVFEATDKISPRTLRKVKNSMGVAFDLLKSGEADAFITVGNTGGAMAIGLARLGRIRGVLRPALSAPFPTKHGTCIVLDIGANADCKPNYLLQFGVMGSIYAELILGVKNPRVGLISNGEEAGKGNELIKASYPLLENSGLNFVGNIEGKELFGGEVDVAVTDGFTGNVLMKGVEAVASFMSYKLKEAIYSSTRTKIGGLLARPAFDLLKQAVDPGAIGAVPLLGLDGLVFVGHGRSDARALLNAIRLARQTVEADLIQSIRESLGKAFK